MFGLYEETEGGAGEGVNVEKTIEPIMNALMNFRDDVKTKANDGPKEMFKLSDEIRDDILPYLGIRLEDRSS